MNNQKTLYMPCYIGDRLFIAGVFTGQIIEVTVNAITVTADNVYFHCNDGITVYKEEQLGQTVFLSREDAEKFIEKGR